MEFREFIASHDEFGQRMLEQDNGTLGLKQLNYLSPVMKFWLAAMLVNLAVLAVLF